MIIYKITNIINNKVYVGQTTESLKQRFSRHMRYQKEDNDTKFYRAVRKYGSMKDCQNDLNIPRHDIIRRRCIGAIKKPYKDKYMFEYAKEGVTTIETITN